MLYFVPPNVGGKPQNKTATPEEVAVWRKTAFAYLFTTKYLAYLAW
jgi:hypothetical protein